MATPGPSTSSAAAAGPYTTRQSFYLRVSAHLVLHALLYLDARDLRWFNALPTSLDAALGDNTDVPHGDVVLGRALAHLRRALLPKLQRERGPPSRASADGLANTSGKETVDVHEENGWRCAYYLRVRERGRHAVLLKNKQLRFPHEARAARARKQRTSAAVAAPLEPTEAVAGSSREGEVRIKPDPDAQDGIDEWGFGTGLNMGAATAGGAAEEPEEDEEMVLEDGDEEEDDKKPVLTVSYRGFRIFDKLLYLVLEPLPSYRRAHPELFRAVSDAPVRQLSTVPLRASSARTPTPVPSSRGGGLFRGESVTTPSPSPAPEPRRREASVAFGRGDEEADGAEQEEESGAVGLANRLIGRNGQAGREVGDGEE